MTTIFEQDVWPGFLEVIASKFFAGHLRCDGHHWHPAAMAIVKTIDEVHVAGSATSRTHNQGTSQVRFRTGGESRNFLVPERHPLDDLLCSQSLGKPVK